jgi:hypothetical protein
MYQVTIDDYDYRAIMKLIYAERLRCEANGEGASHWHRRHEALNNAEYVHLPSEIEKELVSA